MKNKYRIGIIGLGYVGLPLAVEFSKKFQTYGFDINERRINDLNKGLDITFEVNNQDLKSAIDSKTNKNAFLKLTKDIEDLSKCNFYIVTVPTPTDKNKRPVLDPLIKASRSIGRILKKGDFVVYESTVYPGLTEEECLPILEKFSKLKLNKDFYLGYSPERINPGDKKRSLTNIKKITSGSTKNAALIIDSVYKKIIKAGTHLASSIKVAEAAKVIENSQRDINIAFVNELAKIFNILEIDTNEVLEAAGSKWNFLPFKPGLVGGHCIGVDPYYLAQKAQQSGYHPEIILSGRRLNDTMGVYVANEVVKLMGKKNIPIRNSKTLILGFTFKENCPDTRNTKVIDVVSELSDFGLDLTVYDPWADPNLVFKEYGFKNVKEEPNSKFDSIILCVAHEQFSKIDFKKITKKNSVIYDVKGFIKSIKTYKL